MTGFELRICGVGSNRSNNFATNTILKYSFASFDVAELESPIPLPNKAKIQQSAANTSKRLFLQFHSVRFAFVGVAE